MEYKNPTEAATIPDKEDLFDIAFWSDAMAMVAFQRHMNLRRQGFDCLHVSADGVALALVPRRVVCDRNRSLWGTASFGSSPRHRVLPALVRRNR